MAKKNKTLPTTTGQYDKIFKENAEEIYHSLIKSLLYIDTTQVEDLPQSDLQHTIERKADFLKKILPQNGEAGYALHIEIQSDNDKNMHKRMVLYDALIYNKYELDTEQFVIYIGKLPLSMQSLIKRRKSDFSYQIIDIKRYDYNMFLHASTPEEVILAILGNFQNNEPATVIAQILTRLQELVPTTLTFGKYATQLEIISNLRDLKNETLTQLDNMPVIFDITETRAYKTGLAKGEAKGLAKGEAKGEAKGLAKGEAKGEAKGLAKGEAKGLEKGLAKGEEKGLAKGEEKGLRISIEKILRKKRLSIEAIADTMDVSVDFVLEIQKNMQP